MSLLWALPPTAVVLAAVLLLVQLRAIDDEAQELGRQLQRLGEVRAAVVAVRAETEAVRATARSLRSR